MSQQQPDGCQIIHGHGATMPGGLEHSAIVFL